MEFEGLSARLSGVFKSSAERAVFGEGHRRALREVRLSLLEADVNFKVVREFIAQVKGEEPSAEVLESLTPAQQVIKIVNDEMVALMGGKAKPLDLSGNPARGGGTLRAPGFRKDLSCREASALSLRKNGRRVLLVSCDVYRPAAQRRFRRSWRRSRGRAFSPWIPGPTPR